MEPTPIKTNYDVSIDYKTFIENYFLRSKPFAVIGIDDPLLAQLRKAIELDLVPRLHIQELPAGEIKKDDFFDGQPLRDEQGKFLKREKGLVKVWYLSDWEISYKKYEETQKASESREKIYWENKERLKKLIPCVMKATLLDEESAGKIAKSIVEKNLVVIEKDYLEKYA